MSYWGYVIEEINSGDRDALERRKHLRRRRKREREQAVLDAALAVLAEAEAVQVRSEPRQATVRHTRADHRV